MRLQINIMLRTKPISPDILEECTHFPPVITTFGEMLKKQAVKKISHKT